ncbi:MAG: protein kinase [Deltaproteobacteria bacterium]|nr:protein kinase [Deltaproteobacteria bacterium]
MTDRPERRQPGEVVNGRFLIERELGSGSIGEVFLAHDAILDRDVAMKYLKWQPDKPTTVDRFKSEFAALTHLSHPHIIKVFDFAQDERTAQYFFTGEYIGGRDFFSFTTGFRPERIEALFVQALRALEYLHGHNIFHFDIKPQNVLIVPPTETDPAAEARVQLIDFGFAAVGFQNQLIGTPSYIAPEIIMHETPTGQADLYSLGVLFYYALTRWNPFRGKNREETFDRHLHFAAAPPSSINPQIPAYLDDLILRLLAKRPPDRYASPEQVIQDLNLRCGHPYPLETPETVLAYIPWEGQFIGREKMLHEVSDLLDSCREGRQDRPPVVWVRGARGMGKSRFLREIKFTAQLAGHPTYIFDRADITTRTAWLAAIDSAREDPSQPIVLFLDDVHSLIQEGLAVEIISGVRRLIGQVRTQLQLGAAAVPAKVLVIISSLEDTATCKAVEGQLRLPASAARTVTLRPFSREELRAYLATLTGLEDPPAALVEKLLAHTEGNPLFLTEVTKQLIAHRIIIDEQGRWKATTFEDLGLDFQRLQVPPTVEAIVAQEYARLTEPEQGVAAALAIWGKPAQMQDLAALMETAPDRSHLAGLMQKGLLSYDPLTRCYAFRNITKQRAVYHQMGAGEQRRLHARAAALVQGDPDASLEELYAHQAQAGEPETAERALWELAQHQIEVHRPHDAILSLQQLFKICGEEGGVTAAPMIEARSLLASAYRAARDFAGSKREYEGLIAALTGNPRQQSRLSGLHEEMGQVLMKLHDYTGAEAAFMRALAIAQQATKDRVRQLHVENFIGQAQLYRGALPEAITTFRRTAEAAAELSPDEQRRITNNDLGVAHFEAGDYSAAIAQLSADSVRDSSLGDERREMRSRYYLACAHLAVHQASAAAEQYSATLGLAKKCGDVEYLVNAYTGLANVAGREARVNDAVQYYERALDLSGRLGDDERTAAIAINLGLACRKQSLYQRAEGHLLSALAFLETSAHKGELFERYHCTAHLELGELYRLQRRFEAATHHLDEAWNLAAHHSNCAGLRFWIALTRVELLRDNGNVPLARETLPTLRKLATDDSMRQHIQETEDSLVG